MYVCESRTIKKAEHQRIDAFELWCWRRLLRVPWPARRSNQSILKISPGCSLEGLMLKLMLQYFGHLMQRTISLEKNPIVGKIEGRRQKEWQDEMVGWYHQLNRHKLEQTPGDGEGQGSLACWSPWGCRESHTTERLNYNNRWSYVQGSKRDTDVKNRLLDSMGEDEGGMIWENSIETYTSPYVK